MVDVQTSGAALLQNPQFMELFQRALGGEDKLSDMPPEGDPRREKWLRELQAKIREESTKALRSKLEEVQSDENGQWMYVLPTPGFCVKCTLAGGGKVFINVCQHERIAEPVPMEDDESSDEIKFRIPLSCGQARAEVDKSGKPCKVYDVIVNPATVNRCTQDHDFRCFVISLCIHWIKQKNEPTLNSDEYRNMNFRAKGTLEPQRIRLSTAPKAANALGDEIRLPSNGAASTVTFVGGRGGTGKLIEELSGPTVTPPCTTSTPSPAVNQRASDDSKPSILKLQGEGIYDWSTHAKPALNPHIRENVPAYYALEIYIPTITVIAEVDVRVSSKCVTLLYVDAEDGEPFLSVPLDYPIDEDTPDAKFVRKTRVLKLKLRVQLPDETSQSRTKADRDAIEIEEEERQREQQKRDKELLEHRQKIQRIREEEENVMRERRNYVEDLAAVQGGEVPPTLREEVDKLPPEQLTVMLGRLETRARAGDSVDVMLEKFPEAMVDSICSYIRSKLGLQQRPGKGEDKAMEDACTKEQMAAAPSVSGLHSAESVSKGPVVEVDGRIEYNFAKKSEKMFGVAFHNRYLFALD
ncbi:putative pre RNA processing PIH1 Nop17 [Trypanosoma vivax]|uniref:PIH1 domain-containing protein 1 n=1 Tax=Trypanosoma vivax (strain Y486) TaxID=1055687 RepID=G0U2Z5_TRYVY|nr:hypothetical protein TRVL_02697 [Trypanosoma vivax]KAH8604291.1 putative pre RNA processing PIH1 Nop17 [Trypanosoma vivax]CCC50650.1 conserved hypothetical protein [Trypanosoma vivax Y486]